MPDILRCLFPQTRLILRWCDPMERHYAGIARLKARYCDHAGVSLESYSRDDAGALGIEYVPNFADAGRLQQVAAAAGAPAPRVVFVGTSGPGTRALALLRLAVIIDALGIDYEFHICGDTDRILKSMQGTVSPRNLHINRRLFAYADYLRMIADSTCLVDLFRIAEHEGYSYRVPEAVLMGRKLLTDRTALVNEPFYTPHNIFILGDLEESGLGERLAAFLRTPAVPYAHAECLTLKAWARRHGLL